MRDQVLVALHPLRDLRAEQGPVHALRRRRPGREPQVQEMGTVRGLRPRAGRCAHRVRLLLGCTCRRTAALPKRVRALQAYRAQSHWRASPQEGENGGGRSQQSSNICSMMLASRSSGPWWVVVDVRRRGLNQRRPGGEVSPSATEPRHAHTGPLLTYEIAYGTVTSTARSWSTRARRISAVRWLCRKRHLATTISGTT